MDEMYLIAVGPPGVGKSVLLTMLEHLCDKHGVGVSYNPMKDELIFRKDQAIALATILSKMEMVS